MTRPNNPMSRTAGSAFGSTARAGVSATLPAVGYLERSAKSPKERILQVSLIV